jgi:pimeloyl-ACP methyl ester carboxylesterase
MRAARPVRRLPLIGVCAAILFAGGAATASQGRTSADGVANNGIAWHGCGERLQCGNVRVPLDWDRPHGRQIKLKVIRHLASRPGKRIGSMFVNPGGPAGSVDQVKRDGAKLDAAGLGRFDVVGWDLRGAGESTRVRCFRSDSTWKRFFADWALPIPTTTPAALRFLRKIGALARRCGKLSGSLLSHISSGDTARDLDYLRTLVGDRRLTYYGLSNGTFIGQVYANIYPRRVRAMALDGLTDPVAYTKGNAAGFVGQLSNADRAFRGFLTLCQRAGPARCALAGHGSVAARVNRVLARLRRAPIPAPSASPRGQLTYPDALQAILNYMSAGPAYWPDMADALEAAIGGNGSALLTAGRGVTAAFSDQVMPPGLPGIGLTCADSPAWQSPAAWRQVLARFTFVSHIYGPVLFWWRWAMCASWPTRSADRYTGPWNAKTKNPVLVVGTNHDPNTPYANARRVARLLGNAILLTHDGYSHISVNDPSACVKRATSAYLVHLVTPPREKVCPSDHQPFDPGFGQPLP